MGVPGPDEINGRDHAAWSIGHGAQGIEQKRDTVCQLIIVDDPIIVG
jgi:hypothetical protein